MLAGNVSPMTGENVKPAYGGEDEAFLRKVVTPIYEVIARVCMRFYFLLTIKFWAPCIPFCFYLLYHYSIYWKAPLWIGCLTGSWKKQTRKIKTFSMEELWWFKRILLVLDFHLLHFSFSVNMLLEINLPFFNYRSVDCFRLGWPMRADADFFCLPIERLRFEKSEVATLVKWGLFISFSLYSPCSNSAQAIRFALKLPPKIHVLINLKIWSK